MSKKERIVIALILVVGIVSFVSMIIGQFVVARKVVLLEERVNGMTQGVSFIANFVDEKYQGELSQRVKALQNNAD